MDKASPHYRSRKVTDYFEHNKDALIPVYLPIVHTRVYGDGRSMEHGQE